MNEREQAELRRGTAQQRTPPGRSVDVHIESGGIGLFPKDTPIGPIALRLEATDADGLLSAWLVDEWWTEVITHLPHPTVAIHIEPTPDALIHPVVLYQLTMLRRVCPRWRLVGHAYRNDLMADEDFAALATSAYHEVRFLDAPRPGNSSSERAGGDIEMAQLFSRIRRVQPETDPRHPTLVCVPAPVMSPASKERQATLPDSRRRIEVRTQSDSTHDRLSAVAKQ